MQKGGRDSGTRTEEGQAPAGASASGDNAQAAVFGRRGFLKRGVLATAGVAAALTPPFSISRASVEQSSAAKKVLVIGAGLAGLSAAYELLQANHDVTVLEARPRCGGRVWTMRDNFPDDLYAEAGATNVFDNHAWTMKYLKLLDVQLEPMPAIAGAGLYHLRGQRVVIKPDQPVAWPVELAPAEKGLSRSALWAKYIVPLLKDLGDIESRDWPAAALRSYDRLSFAALLRQQGASPGAAEILRLGLADQLGDGAEAVSALNLLREAAPRAALRQNFFIRGGSDTLPKAFAARLGARIHYGVPVVRIEQTAQGVRVVTRQADERRIFQADHLICAIPFSVLKHLQISPGFSPEKQQAIAQLGNTSVVRVFLQTRQRFWSDEGLSGSAVTDLPIMTTYDKAHYLPGTRGMLEAYVAGEKARKLTAMKADERLHFTAQQVGRLLPRLPEFYEGGASVCWDAEEWSRGAYAWFRPGQMEALWPHFARPEGRIHFAGDHLSPWPGWMNGALQSGYRAALEVSQAN